MPAGTKTFMRQRITLDSSQSARKQAKADNKICGMKNENEAAKMPGMGEQAEHDGHSTETNDVDIACTTQSSDKKSDVQENGGCQLSDSVSIGDSQEYYLPSLSENRERSSTFLSHMDCLVQKDNTDIAMNTSPIDSNTGGYQKQDEDTCIPLDKCETSANQSVQISSKVNESISGSGVLRYAVHLRFLCPPRRCSKTIQRCKSDPFSLPHAKGTDAQERRFYVYNDLRVVFPQRHSDADEGKLRVESHFPFDPKYFDMSN